MVVVSFHIGPVQTLGAIFERLPGPKLALFHRTPIYRPGIRVIDTAERTFAFAAKCALDTLKADGFVFSIADGVGQSQVEADVCGRRIVLPRGTFTIARLAGAPLLPVAARWRGPAIEIICGDPIAPGDESEMATALVRWLESYLIEHPDQAGPQLRELLQRAPLADGPRPQGALHDPVTDFPGLRSRNSPRLDHDDPVRGETERVEDCL
jgi:hypothetical protein